MKSTKYQLLKAEYEFACDEVRTYKKVIDDLIKENEKLKWELNIYKKLKPSMKLS